MAAKSGLQKKDNDIQSSKTAGEKDLLILELKNRIAALENELHARPNAVSADAPGLDRTGDERDTFYQYSQDILAIIGFDDQIKRVSPSIEKILGWKKDEITGKPFFDLTHPDDWETSINMMKEHRNGRDAQFENRVLCKDGSYRWIAWNAHALVDEKKAICVGRDITGRKEAEQELWYSKEKFRNVFENAAAGIVIADISRGYHEVNDRFCEITGYSREELLQMGCTEIVHPDDQAADIAEVQRLVRGEAPSFMRDLRYVHASGKTVWARVNASLMRIGNLDEPRIVAVVEDITEQKYFEDTHRKNEKFLNNVFNCIQDGVSVLSNDLSVIRYNPTIEKWHGKGLTGKKCYRLFHGREEPCENCPSVRAIRDKTMQREVVHDLYGWKEIFAYPLVNDDGEITGTIEQVRDISGRKRAEEERERLLKDAEEQSSRLRAILDSLPVGVWIADASGKITIVNDVAQVILGGKFPYPDSIPDYGVFKCRLPGTDELLKPEENPLPRAVLYGDITRNMIVDIELFNGKHAIHMVSAAPTRDSHGAIIGGVAITQDITDIKRTEEELKAAKMQAELYLDLMGHDITNFNQSAMGYLELALEMLEEEGKIKQDGRIFIEKPLQAIKGSSTLIANVRKLQRMMTGGVRTWPVDLHNIFEELKAHDYEIGDKNVTVNFANIPHYLVEGNELLRDVFYNLINNAVKHSSPDMPVKVDVKVERTDKNGRTFYKCTIEDDGSGIPDALKPKLFHRFQRGKTKAYGKGLGLYIVRTLVEGYHGKVWVEDRVRGDHAKGARFVIMLPAVGAH